MHASIYAPVDDSGEGQSIVRSKFHDPKKTTNVIKKISLLVSYIIWPYQLLFKHCFKISNFKIRVSYGSYVADSVLTIMS